MYSYNFLTNICDFKIVLIPHLNNKKSLPQPKSPPLLGWYLGNNWYQSQDPILRFDNLRVKIMANISRPQMLERQSTHRPPLFTGSDYDYWKTRLTLYIKAQDYYVWRVIANGPHIPTKTMEWATIVKLESEWNEAHVNLIELNCKAMSSLYCALDPNEFNRV